MCLKLLIKQRSATGVGIEIRTSTDRTAWTYVGLVWPNGAPAATNKFTGTTNGYELYHCFSDILVRSLQQIGRFGLPIALSSTENSA
jgi:hypothetical protein